MKKFTYTSQIPCDNAGQRNVSLAPTRECPDEPSETRAALLFLPSSLQWWWRPEVCAFLLPVTSVVVRRRTTARWSYWACAQATGPIVHDCSASKQPVRRVSFRTESCLTLTVGLRRGHQSEVLPLRQRSGETRAVYNDWRRPPVGHMRVNVALAASSVTSPSSIYRNSECTLLLRPDKRHFGALSHLPVAHSKSNSLEITEKVTLKEMTIVSSNSWQCTDIRSVICTTILSNWE